MKVAGIDGTKAGWVVACWSDGALTGFAAATIADALERLHDAEAVSVDMPIGFMETAEPGGRLCEKAARASMPGCTSSVFSSPCRPALEAAVHAEASALNRASSPHGIGLSQQSFALFSKMREIDAALSADMQHRVFEVHPELSFTLLSESLGRADRLEGKKTLRGMQARIGVLEEAGFDPEALLQTRKALRVSEDDVIDACAAAWSAWRKARGQAIRFPDDPPRDRRGLAMEMWA